MKFSVAVILSFCHAACGQKRIPPAGPADYDLTKPEKFNMPESLLEISGITFYQNNPDTIYAEQDERGRLYRFHPGDTKVEHAVFGKDGDYEDLAILKDRFFILRSDGSLFSFPLSKASSERIEEVAEYKKVVPKGEYEGLAADERSGKLYVLCKNCKMKEAGGYILDPDSLDRGGMHQTFRIDFSDFPKQNKKDFKPSALAKHPGSGDWYILSSVNKKLVITDGNFKAKDIFDLHNGLFLQPEGIAFDKEKNLYISNEGDELRAGNILKFKVIQ